MSALKDDIHEAESVLLAELRDMRRVLRAAKADKTTDGLTNGQRVADTVAATMGSWRFIIIQSVILIFWIILNVTAYIKSWDPYPFILLNLALSFQAAYAAPFIMMSQNRQQDIDRKATAELVHRKLYQLREQEVLNLSKAGHDLTELLNRSGICAPAKPDTATPDAESVEHPPPASK